MSLDGNMRASLAAEPLQCLHDGSIVERGLEQNWSSPCRWDAQPPGLTHDDDCPAATLLRRLRAGQVGKRALEVVVAQSDGEDIAWAEPLGQVLTVYRKEGTEVDDAAAQQTSPPDAPAGRITSGAVGDSSSVVVLPNVGREQHTILHHIISRYDDGLADRTVFMHGQAPSCGLFGGQWARMLKVPSLERQSEPNQHPHMSALALGCSPHS